MTEQETTAAGSILSEAEIQEVARLARLVAVNVGSVILGKEDVIESCLVALLAGGHVVVEDYPGVGKTLLAKALARSVGGRYSRIQFTPDLLPSDVTGVNVFDQRDMRFEFHPGPVFANVVLADEINRASPKTQASLLECMEEGQATIDNVAHRIAPPFLILATQNPIEYEGTYPLPEAQLDRFMLRLRIGYPSREAEEAILESQTSGDPFARLEPVIRGGGRARPAGGRPAACGRPPSCADTWSRWSRRRGTTATSTSAPARAPASRCCARPRRWPSCAAGTTSCRRTSRTSGSAF